LGKEATKYISKELNSKVEIGSIQLDFFESATLNKIFILDKHHDTILYGDILIKIKDFDYKNKSITIQKITLKNINSKIIKYKKDLNYNYDFLINYFSSNNKEQTNSKWNIKFDELELNNVSFIHKNENEIHCALREFEEETNISSKNISVNKNITFEEYYVGSNNLIYKSVYYTAYIPYIPKKIYKYFPSNIRTKFISSEIYDMEWLEFKDVFQKLDETKKDVITKINNYILKKKF
jgi:hypothetical protein